MTQTEALKLALEALELTANKFQKQRDAITAIKEALAQQSNEQVEPICEIIKSGLGEYPVMSWRTGYVAKIGDKFYTHPPVPNAKLTAQPDWESILGAIARGWCYEENANKTIDKDLAEAIAKEVQCLYTIPPQVGLTEQEVDECYELVMFDPEVTPSRVRVYQAIEAKLKEKNGI